MDIIYGCECFGKNCMNHLNANNDAPCAFIVRRKGVEIKVCTKCDLPGDEYVARLFDGYTDVNTFMEYDILGGFCIIGLIEDEAWQEYQARHNSTAKS